MRGDEDFGYNVAMPDYSLNGKHALVCGSSQGIGRACAEAFAEMGASVTLLARNREALEIIAGELPTNDGQTHRALIADFSDWNNVSAVIWPFVEEHGAVHILLNNTGGPGAGPAFEAKPEQYAQAFEQHLLCNQTLAQACAGGMRDAGYGRIINIISTSVMQPIKNLGVSNTIRGAVANWAKTLASELGPFGITVNNILPGFTATARLRSLFEGKASRAGTSVENIEEQAKADIPARRLGDPAEIASVAAFLASPAASYVSGVNIPVDGGRLATQ